MSEEKITKADAYQKLALKTEKTPMFINPAAFNGDQGHAVMLSRLLHGMIGVVTEIGEAMDAVKKHLIYGKPLDLVNIMEEAGDKQWYIALILDAAGYLESDAMTRNIAKLKARFGDKFTEEAALNRDLGKERATLESGAEHPKFLNLLRAYHQRFTGMAPVDPKVQQGPVHLTYDEWTTEQWYGHMTWACEQAMLFLANGHVEKAMRWFGFTQGVMFQSGTRTIVQLGDETRAVGKEAPVPAERWRSDTNYHQKYNADWWCEEVGEGNTELGYHDWVVHQIESNKV